MKSRAVGSLLLGLAFVLGPHQHITSAEHAAIGIGMTGRPAQFQRRESFIPGVPTTLNTPVSLTGAIAIPGDPLVSTDLLWVDQASERLFVADRSNFGVDIIDAENDRYVGRVTGFVGPTDPRGGGPNGLLVTPDNKLWAGDGRSLTQVADLSLNPPRIIRTIDTRGTNRADELAYDPADHIILIGNDRETPPYATLISTDDYRIIGTIPFRDATGLEQPWWDSQLHRFLLNVPAPRSYIAVIDPKNLSVEKTYPTACGGGTGLVLGPFQRLLVACGLPYIMNAVNGSIISTVTQVNSGDEVWYNSGDGQFYVTSTDNAGATVLGVIDGLTGMWRQNVPAPGARNVSALAANNHIFAAVRAPAAGVTDTTLCARFGIRDKGCVAVFTHGK